jgi:micrococcal nuclease
VWLKGHLFNATLIRKGFATTSFYAPNYRYRRWFNRLEAAARDAGRGLWGACR